MSHEGALQVHFRLSTVHVPKHSLYCSVNWEVPQCMYNFACREHQMKL